MSIANSVNIFTWVKIILKVLFSVLKFLTYYSRYDTDTIIVYSPTTVLSGERKGYHSDELFL